MEEWLEKNAIVVDQECWIGNARVVAEDCNSSRLGMQESAGVKKQVSN